MLSQKFLLVNTMLGADNTILNKENMFSFHISQYPKDQKLPF